MNICDIINKQPLTNSVSQDIYMEPVSNECFEYLPTITSINNNNDLFASLSGDQSTISSNNLSASSSGDQSTISSNNLSASSSGDQSTSSSDDMDIDYDPVFIKGDSNLLPYEDNDVLPGRVVDKCLGQILEVLDVEYIRVLFVISNNKLAKDNIYYITRSYSGCRIPGKKVYLSFQDVDDVAVLSDTLYNVRIRNDKGNITKRVKCDLNTIIDRVNKYKEGISAREVRPTNTKDKVWLRIGRYKNEDLYYFTKHNTYKAVRLFPIPVSLVDFILNKYQGYHSLQKIKEIYTQLVIDENSVLHDNYVDTEIDRN